MSTQCPLNLDIQDDCCVQPDLVTRRLSTSLFVIDEGHVVSRQAVKPAAAPGGAAGLTAASTSASSTDAMGSIIIAGTAAANSTVTVTYHDVYPPNADCPPIVILTPLNGAAGVGTASPWVTSTRTTFVITFSGASGANPIYGYSVSAPIATDTHY